MNSIVIKIKEYIKDHNVNSVKSLKIMINKLQMDYNDIIRIMYFVELEQFRNSFK